MNWSVHLLGRNRKTSLRFLLIAVGLFIAFLIIFGISETIFYWVFTGYGFFYFLVAFLGLAALNAYLNDGLVISFLLAYIPTLGLLLYNVGLFTDFGLPALLVGFIYAAVAGLLYGLPPGVVGYLLGSGVRRFRTDSTA